MIYLQISAICAHFSFTGFLYIAVLGTANTKPLRFDILFILMLPQNSAFLF